MQLISIAFHHVAVTEHSQLSFRFMTTIKTPSEPPRLMNHNHQNQQGGITCKSLHQLAAQPPTPPPQNPKKNGKEKISPATGKAPEKKRSSTFCLRYFCLAHSYMLVSVLYFQYYPLKMVERKPILTQ